jgi:cold shock CspA family protein
LPFSALRQSPQPQEVSDRPGTGSTPPGTTQRTLWDIYLSIKATELGHVGMLVATIEAADENEAVEKAPGFRPDCFDHAGPILVDAMKLYDIIRYDFRDTYNKVTKGNAGALKIVDKASKKKAFSFPFADLPDDEYRLNNGAALPILAAFRNLVEIERLARTARWIGGFEFVLKFWDSVKEEAVTLTHQGVGTYGRTPNAIGKARPHWTLMHLTFDRRLAHMLEKKADRRPAHILEKKAAPILVPLGKPAGVMLRQLTEEERTARAHALAEKQRKARPVPTGPERQATVKWFSGEKGFGFVELTDGSGEAFLHISVVEAAGHAALEPGTTLTVRVGEGPKGPQITEITAVDSSTAEPEGT